MILGQAHGMADGWSTFQGGQDAGEPHASPPVADPLRQLLPSNAPT